MRLRLLVNLVRLSIHLDLMRAVDDARRWVARLDSMIGHRLSRARLISRGIESTDFDARLRVYRRSREAIETTLMALASITRKEIV